jgi:transposase
MRAVKKLFVKTTKAKNYEYIKLVETYRKAGKVKHRVLFNFGRRDLIKDDKMFVRMVKKLCEIAEIPLMESDQDLPDCSEAELLQYGYLAYRKLYEDLGIASILRAIQNQTDATYPLEETVFLMALQHLLDPRSKRGTCEHQHQYYGLTEVQLHQLYRSLNLLADHKEHIEKSLFDQRYTCLGNQVDVVFYDVTTFAFESVIADALREFGFSKDQKFKEVQIVMGLMIDTQGIPIGYELFPGNTGDGKTLMKSLENINRRFGIHRVIIVADRGINSKENLKAIKDAGYGYIVASRIRQMSRQVQQEILSPEGYTPVSPDFRYKTLEYTNIFKDQEQVHHSLAETLVVSYSASRAQKDHKDRQRLIEKARKMLASPSSIKAATKRGGRKYLKEDTATHYCLDEKKIHQDEIFDGYYALQTSEKGMPVPDILEAYHTLWKIEESFRIMKSTLEVRPVFHWTSERIHGHFVVCFLAFLMERQLELLLSKEDAAPEKIREALKSMQLAKVTLNNEEVFIKAKGLPLGSKIFKELGIKQPGNICYENVLKERLKIEPKEGCQQISMI